MILRRTCKFIGVLVLGVGYLPTYFSSQSFKDLLKAKQGQVQHDISVVCCLEDDQNSTSDNNTSHKNIFASLEKQIDTDFSCPANLLENYMPKNSARDQFLHSVSLLHCENLQNIPTKTISSSETHLVASKTPSKTNNSVAKVIASGKFANSTVIKGVVNSNFYVDAMRLGIPAKVIDSMIKNLSAKINFRRSLKKGNTFEVMFDKQKKLVYCSMKAGKNNKLGAAVYGMNENGKMIYYRDDGTKVIPPSNQYFGRPLATPMIISSPYGTRIHPITRVRHCHTGVDLRAKYGSPVYAISDGLIVRASPYAGYGHCIEVSHAAGYKSLYAHLSRYAVRCGARVKKGQLIGWTGSSGTSTGPHLHLELARYNKLLNPMTVKMLPNDGGKINNIRAFEAHKKQVQSVVNKVR